MIIVSVLYANTASQKFNMDYYLTTHIPMISKLLGPALKGALVQQGISGGAPGSAPAFRVITQLQFDSLDAYQAAFMPHAPAIMGDLPNFCSEPPSLQISDIKLS